MKLILATQNPHKLDELRSVLPAGWELISAREAGVLEELPETGRTLEANATQKALFLWEQTGIPSLADDSGLEVDALNGEPGVDSAYYGGPQKSDSDNRRVLLNNMRDQGNRNAAFRTVIAWATSEGVSVHQGRIAGSLLRQEQGAHGFGYDSLFVPHDGDGRTFAEMLPEEKKALSHRSRAVAAWLKAVQKS